MLSTLKSLFKRKNHKNHNLTYKEHLRDTIDLFHNYLNAPSQWKKQLDYKFEFFCVGIDENTGRGMIYFLFRETIDSIIKTKQINNVVIKYIVKACNKLAESILKIALLEAVNELYDIKAKEEKRPAINRDKIRIQDAIELITQDLEKRYNTAIAWNHYRIEHALEDNAKNETKNQKQKDM